MIMIEHIKMMQILYLDIWSVLLSRLVDSLEQFQSIVLIWAILEKREQGTPGIMGHFFVPLEIPSKTKLHPWKNSTIMLHLLEISRPKTKTPGNSA